MLTSADSLELDYYAGYSAEINEDFSLRYHVLITTTLRPPADPKGDFLEYYASANWKSLTLGLTIPMTSSAETGNALYYYGRSRY